MNTINTFNCYINGTLKTEGHVCSEKIVIYSLGKGDDIKTFLA